jgi:hypothetical protein
MTQLEDYVSSCRKAGFYFTSDDGNEYVAGVTEGSGGLEVYVEWLRDPSAVAVQGLLGDIRRQFVKARKCIVRVPAAENIPDWDRMLVEVVSARGAGREPVSVPETFSLSLGAGSSDDLVHVWLVQAIRAGQPGIDIEDADESASLIMSDPRRRSLLVWHDSKCIGHATVLESEHDPVTGMTFDRLVDVLVDEKWRSGDFGREARSLLVQCVLNNAYERGLPVVGDVSYPTGNSTASGHVLQALINEGWTPWYQFLSRGL